MLDFTKLWDKTYLFGPNPVELSRSDFIFFWAAVVLVVLAVGLKLWNLRNEPESPKRYFLNRFFHLGLTMGLLMLLWTGARWQDIPWIGTHVVVLALWISLLVWLYFIFRYYFQAYRKQQQAWEEERMKQEYLGNRR